ncbi:IS21 family transposase, partial [Bacillus sp. SIMBA_161]
AKDYIEKISADYGRYRRDQFALIKKVTQENAEWAHLALEKCINENLFSANAFRDVVDFLRRTKSDQPMKLEENRKLKVDIAVKTRDMDEYLQLMGGKRIE